MTKFAYDIFYDPTIECFVWSYNGAGICLSGGTLSEAQNEVLMHVDNGEYPEDEEEDEYFRDDVEADADVSG